MVFYRKYRPQKIQDLDSEEVRESLYAVLSKPPYPHAFLFTGPKGLGKTSTARILAKVLNCEKRKEVKSKDTKDLEPCNKCDSCISITNGSEIDVLEIDAASNRGIDEIRDLREKIRLAPFKAKRKVYIIDEVHMLTTEAFNALLKTLEEPPSHSLFILCTTEPHKIPPTIISRCFHISFKRATNEELVRSFQRILKGENLTSDKETLLSIASSSDGSFRDGAKLIEELALSQRGGKITKELLEKIYKTDSIDKTAFEMLAFLKDKKTKDAINLLEKIKHDGLDLKFFTEKLLLFLHGALLEKTGVSSENRFENLDYSLNEIKELSDKLNKSYIDSKYSVIESLPIEIAIIEWSLDEKSEAVVNDEIVNENTIPSKAVSSDSSSDNILTSLIEKVKQENFSIAGVLRGCKVKSYDGKTLVLETGYKFHKEKLEEAKTMSIIENVLLATTGKNANISVILREVKS